MRFPPDFLDDLRSRVPLSRVIGNAVRLKRQGHELVGLCPFHQEKGPSFAVSDTKGLYHCHGCGVGGDAISWFQARRGLSFSEAVTELAGMAGVPLPSQGPEAMRREARRLGLIEVLMEAQRFFQSQLTGAPRAYLAERGVDDGTISRTGLGYCPPGGLALHDRLVGRAGMALLVASGLVAVRDDGTHIDRLRGRVTVPIADTSGRVVGFGGRGLGDARPKYLNTPETEAFSKGSLLYNAHAVRQAVHDGARLHVVEGYFDAISCTNAGLPAVATMGTAITEAQLLGLWRLNPEPVLLLDGDRAGRAAAARAVTVALPLLLPGRSMRVCLLPPGLDPDDIIRNRGVACLRAAVDASLTLPGVWWLLGTQNASLTDVASRAAMEEKLISPLRGIPDRALQRQWVNDMHERLRAVAALKPIFRANGHTLHSTNPGSIRLVHALEVTAGFTLREAALIAQALHRAGDMTEAELAVRGLSARTQAVLQEIALLVGSMPPGEVRASLAGGLREAVDEAYGVIHDAGIVAYG